MQGYKEQSFAVFRHAVAFRARATQGNELRISTAGPTIVTCKLFAHTTLSQSPAPLATAVVALSPRLGWRAARRCGVGPVVAVSEQCHGEFLRELPVRRPCWSPSAVLAKSASLILIVSAVSLNWTAKSASLKAF
eukprot:scaffold922_cov327-Pinguiococcus_pyrenoidosus.AAC.26